MDFSQNSSRSISYMASSWNQMRGGSWNGQDQDFFSLSRAGSAAAVTEEEALRWAAIEKLPTYDRLNTGIMRKPAFSCSDMDDRTQQYSRCQMSMCSVDRHEFIERILMKGENDNEMFLRKLRNRIDKAGVKLPTVEVRFENLKVEAKCHVGSRALPTLLNEAKNVAEAILGLFGISLTRKINLNILKDVSGIIRPSRMTLLLGPPSSGKTTLLRSLAGKLDPSLEMGGEVTYNGYKLCEFVPQKTAAYISQNDIHTGEMTVKETLDFSARCQGVGDRYELLSELARREKALGIVPEPEVDLFMKATSIGGAKNSLQTDYTLSILGLDICANTVVGDEMRRGISGGQMKRVTTGEMIVGPTKTLFMDEISTGLDSSTTHHVVKCLQQIVHLGEATILMSLLQPAPETFELFDDIILIAEGLIIYQGPRNYVLEFFESSGFQCPERKGIADFLQEVISRKDQEQYWADKRKPYQFISPTEFVRCFKKFHVGRNLYNMQSIPFDKSKSHGAALVLTKRSVPLKEILNASFAKEWLLIKRNSFVYVFKTIQLLIVALITSTFFLRTSMHARTEADGVKYLGALIFGLVVNMFNGFAELHLAILRLPVFYKQRDFLFYPTWVFTLPNCIIRIPISFLESAVWVTVTYYAVGFAPEACRFFKQLLIFFLVQQTAAGLFRLVAGLTRSISAANTVGCLLTLLLFALGGFTLPKALIPKWWTWGYWLSPLTHSFTALAINEMFSSKWMNTFAPDGRKLGVAVLENMDIFTEKSWYWKSVGILCGYSILFNVLFTLSLMYLHPLGKPTPAISEETALEMQTGQIEAMEYSTIRRALSLGNIVSRSLSVDKGNKSEMLFQSQNDCANNFSPEWRSLETYQNEINVTAPRKGMALPFLPLAMSFNDVSYYVDMPPEMKEQGVTEERLQLLREISGAFRPGILTALMGVSGAGKTTLMDVLAGRKTGGYIDGDIKISGYPKKQATFVRVSGYCEQFDIHSPQLTVKESLLFSAFLRLVNEFSGEEKTRFVDEVMELVELDNLKDALVGLAGVSGLSTEQRKRLTIAVELVANPSIIYMDEPTSGLDARAAAIVMRTVRNTVDTGRTVVCTIHQPSFNIFKTFDELLLLKRGGQIIYSGPLGQNCQKLVEYFEAIPGVQKIKDGLNPADWMLEASSVATEGSLGINFSEIYKSSSLYKRNNALIRELAKPLPGSSDIFFPTHYPQSRVGQLKICLWKQWTIYWRSPEYNFFRLGMTLVIALLLGSIFWKIGQHRDDSANLNSVIGAMYLAVLFVGFGNCATVQPLVATERLVFYREKAAGMYSALPYALSQVIVELPYVLFQALYYTLIIYSMMNFQWTTIKFLWFFLISFLSFLYFTYYGMMTVAVSPNIQVAGILSASFFFLFNLFSGIFLPRPQIPKWWTWYYWFCPVAWTLYGLIVTQYSDIYDMIKVPGQADQQIRDYVINHFGYRDDYLGLIIAVLFGFPVIFAVIYIYCIQYMNFQQR